jgi:hypothetical protein
MAFPIVPSDVKPPGSVIVLVIPYPTHPIVNSLEPGNARVPVVPALKVVLAELVFIGAGEAASKPALAEATPDHAVAIALTLTGPPLKVQVIVSPIARLVVV